MRRARFARRVAIGASLALAAAVAAFEHVPATIALERVALRHGDLEITGRAPELVPLARVEGKGLWAARGYDVYFLPDGGEVLERRGRPWVGFGTALLGYSRIARLVANKQELVELRELSDGTVLAFAGGKVHRSRDGGRTFEAVATLAHFGFGEGRGVMPAGISEADDGTVYYGEYWRNRRLDPVRVWASVDRGATWAPAVEFAAGEVRHVHAVQRDPYARAIWIATGDLDRSSRIGVIPPRGGRYTAIGGGAQRWRAVSLLFTKDAVLWGMDGEDAGEDVPVSVWRWDRRTEQLSRAATLDGLAFYSAATDGALAISTAAEHRGYAELVVSDAEGSAWRVAARWTRARRNHHGTVRLEAGPGGTLYLGVLSLEPFRGDLLQARIASPGLPDSPGGASTELRSRVP